MVWHEVSPMNMQNLRLGGAYAGNFWPYFAYHRKFHTFVPRLYAPGYEHWSV